MFFFRVDYKYKMSEQKSDVSILNGYSVSQLEAEFKDLNNDLNTSLKSFCPLIENVLNSFKNEPESFENNKV